MVDKRFFPYAGPLSLGSLCVSAGVALNAQDPRSDIEITGASEPALAKSGDIALIANRKYAAEASAGRASVYIVAEGLDLALPDGSASLAVADPHAVFVRMLDTLFPNIGRFEITDMSESGHVPKLEDDVVVGEGVVFGSNVEIGSGSIIGPGSVIGRGVTIGRNCVIGPHVSVEYAHLGDGVTILAGARIGGDGFGWLDHGRSNVKIPQLGRVLIQDRVEIGANTTIDRGALGDTVIGDGTKIDNLVQIGHNCKIGRNCLIAAMCGISGSTTIGDGVLMGGNVGTSGHLTIGAGSIVHGRAAVTKDWPAGSKLAGAPAQDIKDFWRELALIRRLGKGD